MLRIYKVFISHVTPSSPPARCASLTTTVPVLACWCNYWLHSQFIVTWIRDKNSGRYIQSVGGGHQSCHSAVTSA